MLQFRVAGRLVRFDWLALLALERLEEVFVSLDFVSARADKGVRSLGSGGLDAALQTFVPTR